jgi:hypothetical protein
LINVIAIILISAAAATHAFIYGRWLFKNGNKAGAFLSYLTAAACVALPVYRYMIAP